MKQALTTTLALAFLIVIASILAQDHPAGIGTQPSAASGDLKTADTDVLEARFAATLSNSAFSGRWCLIHDGKLGPMQEDKYTIIGARKVGGDTWLIHTRVQYGDRNFVAPLPVQVKWAGDTAVIVVDNLAMPGGAIAYSARVVVHKDTYAGTWAGGDHAGLLMGVITHETGQGTSESK